MNTVNDEYKETLYHGTRNDDLKLESDYWYNTFNGLFFTEKYDTAESFGGYIHEIQVGESEICDDEILYHHEDEVYEACKKIIEEEELNVDLDDFVYTVTFDKSLEITGDYGDDRWAIQRYRLECAQAIGYEVCRMSDETGTSYLISYDYLLKHGFRGDK